MSLIRRNKISILLISNFLFLSFSGVLLFINKRWDGLASLHSISGFLFVLSAFFHLYKNIKPLTKYFYHNGSIQPSGVIISIVISLLAFASYYLITPFNKIAEFGFKLRNEGVIKVDDNLIQYNLAYTGDSNIEFIIKEGIQFWYPQIAIWVEDKSGKYLKTLFITNSTSKGEFYTGKTKDNFKIKTARNSGEETVWVNALPYWASRSSIQLSQKENLEIDGVTSATPESGFRLRQNISSQDSLIVFLEVNVAFDENEFYSEYAFPDDSLYHNGTGLLGQPSLIYAAHLNNYNINKYQLMEFFGHTHPTGSDFDVKNDKEGLTTALSIIDYILIKNQGPISKFP